MPEVTPFRLNLLRALYLVIFLGQGALQGPLVIGPFLA